MNYQGNITEFHFVKNFALIELLFAISLVTLGFFGITTITSIGLDVGKDAINRSIATDAAAQFLHFNSSKIRDDWTWNEILPDEKPEFDDSVVSNSTEWGWSKESLLENGAVRVRFATMNREDEFDSTIHKSGYFLYSLQTKEYEKLEFSIRAWKNVTDLGLAGENAVINVEVSYPIYKPYPERQKQHFRVEVFKISDMEIAALP